MKKVVYLVLLILFLVAGSSSAATTIKQRGDTAAAWISANTVLADREVGWETDTRKAKLGDGVTAWNALPYVVSDGGGGGVSDHGALTGKSDDDHPQYLDNARGDAKYSLLGHSQPASTISDSTAAGRSLLTAADVAAIRTLLNTDQVSDSRAPTTHQHPATEISDSGAVGRTVIIAETQADLQTAVGLGTAGTYDTGTGIGQVLVVQDIGPCTPLGVCSNGTYTTKATCEANAATWTPYDSQSICTTAGGSWTPTPGIKTGGADYASGTLTVDGVPVVPGEATYAGLTGVPSEFTPSSHEHAQTDITGLVARLVALEDQVTALDANLALAGFPTLTIDQTGTVAFTAATTTLTGTATDNGSVTALEYQIDGGAWSNIVPLTTPWSQDITGASLTPNVASTVTVRATDDTALARTRSVQLVYQTPVITVSPSTKAFADTATGGSSATQQFTWTNTGLATKNPFVAPALSGGDALHFGLSGNTCGASLAPSASCTANVVFSPTTEGAKTASVSAGEASASLSGTGLPGFTYLNTYKFEGAEGAGLPSGFTLASGTGFNFDYGVSPLEGLHSFRAYDPVSINGAITAQDSGYVGFKLRINTMPAANSTFLTVRQSEGGMTLAALRRTGATTIKISADSSSFSTDYTITPGVDYFVKIYFAKSTGIGDGVARYWVSTNGTTWTFAGEMLNGNTITAGNQILFGAGSGGDFVFDDIRVSASDFNF